MEGVTAIETAAGDWRLVQELRRGEESAFVTLLEQYHNSMLRLSQYFVHDRAAAEEVVQATWWEVLSEVNQRVLLHRARSKVRRALELYLGESE